MTRVFIYLVSYSAIMLPSYVFLLLSVDYSKTYVQGVNYVYAPLFQIFVITILCFICALRIKRKEKTSEKLLVSTKKNKKITALVHLEKYAVAFYLLLSCLILISGSNDYRHSSSFAENAVIATAAETLRTFILSIMVVKVCNPKVPGVNYNNNYLPVIFIISSVIGSTGSYMVIQALFVCSLCYLYNNDVTLSKVISLGMGSTIIILIAIFIGFANKFNFNFNKVYTLFMIDTSYVINYLGWRVATFLHSITFWLSHRQDFDVLAIAYDESVYRILKIMGEQAVPSDIRSMARINYLNIFIDNSHPRSGTTPGLFGGVASLLYNNKTALVVLILLTVSLIRIIACYPARALGVLPVMIIAASSYHFFDSIIDYLIVPEPNTFYLIIFLSTIYFVRIRMH